jgi:methionine aminotransferase
MGYVCAPKELMVEFRKVHQFNAFVSNAPVQYAFADYMLDPGPYLELSHFYQKKRDLFREGIAASRFRLMPSRGTFFQCVGYEAITDERDTDLAIRLTKERGVASIPVSVFYNVPRYDKVLRFCFAKKDETLLRGAEILCKI